MAAQIRIIFTPVLKALKSGLAQARAMIQQSLDNIEVIPLKKFGVGQLTGEIAKLTPVSKNVATSIAGLRQHFKDLAATQVTATTGASKFISAIGSAGASMKKLGKSLSNTGRRMSWFGFRLIMFGRMFQRMLMMPIKKGLTVFKTWDKSITEIATSMGFLAASGMLSGDMMGTMMDVMGDLPSLGMQVQGMFGAITTLFGQIGRDIIPALIDPIVDLISVLSQLWTENRDKLVPIFKEIGNLISEELIPLFKESGGAMITGLAEGLKIGVQWLTELLKAAKPHIPWLSKFTGILIAMSPFIIAVGAGIFILATAFAAVGVVLGLLTSPIGLVIAAIALLYLAWKTNFGGIRDLVSGFVSYFTTMFEKIMKLFDDVIKKAKELLTPFKNIADAIGGTSKKVADFIGSFGKAQEGVEKFANAHDYLLGTLDDAYGGQSVGKDMAKQYGIAGEALANLMKIQTDFATIHKKVMADLEEPVGGQVIQNWAEVNTPLPANMTQHIDISIVMDIETLSADTDIDALVDEMSRKLAEKIEYVG